jgi:hypothetical protein
MAPVVKFHLMHENERLSGSISTQRKNLININTKEHIFIHGPKEPSINDVTFLGVRVIKDFVTTVLKP